MSARNCRKCGRMFNHTFGEPLCPVCREKNEDVFQRVKKFVQDNHQAMMNEIVEACDVDVKQIKQWIREERLFFADDSPVKINCEACGTQIATGRFCDNCKKDTLNSMSNAARRPEAPAPAVENRTNPNSRMYTFKK